LKRDPRLKLEMDLFNYRYRDEMTYRGIEKKTKIPLVSCFQIIEDAEILIRNYITKKQNRLI
jgi:hypothetical protein